MGLGGMGVKKRIPMRRRKSAKGVVGGGGGKGNETTSTSTSNSTSSGSASTSSSGDGFISGKGGIGTLDLSRQRERSILRGAGGGRI